MKPNSKKPITKPGGPQYQFIDPIHPEDRIKTPVTASSTSASNIVRLSIEQVRERFPQVSEEEIKALINITSQKA